VVALGPQADQVISNLCERVGIDAPDCAAPKDKRVLFWRPGVDRNVRVVEPVRPRQKRKRHSRKYAGGMLDEAGSFYFRGPNDKMKLRVHNLTMFVQVAEGIDEETWDHHRRRGDYSTWFRKQIRDDELADEAAAVEQDPSIDPAEGRKRVIDAVKRRYTAP